MKRLFHGTPSAALFFTLLVCGSTGMSSTDKIRTAVDSGKALGVDRSLALEHVLHNVSSSRQTGIFNSNGISWKTVCISLCATRAYTMRS